jgi:CDP-diacylglycerol---serine O-phosphatidyltransferase
MMARFRRPQPPRRALVFLPNGFTLFNLFCGIHSIVLSSRLNFGEAAKWIVIGGIADALDGRVARATGTGSRFGEELDSLVDAISFGLAPAMIMFFAVLNRGNWEWLFAFYFVACAVMRLARFNVEQAGRSKTHFHGLPSPAAGMTLATYYWFSQTTLYNQTIIFLTDSTTLADLPWHTIMRFLMVALASLMVSDVPYPAVPTIGYKSVRQMFGTLIVLGGAVALVVRPREVLFPALLGYVMFGALKWVVLGLVGSRGEPDAIYFEPDPDEEPPMLAPSPPSRRMTPAASPAVSAVSRGALDEGEAPVRRKRRRRRGKDGRRQDSARNHPDGERPRREPGAPPQSPPSTPPSPSREDSPE